MTWDRGIPCPDLGWGYPHPDLGWGYPYWEGWGTPPVRKDGIIHPPSIRKGVPSPISQMGVSPPKCGQTDNCENSTFPIPSECERKLLVRWALRDQLQVACVFSFSHWPEFIVKYYLRLQCLKNILSNTCRWQWYIVTFSFSLHVTFNRAVTNWE